MTTLVVSPVLAIMFMSGGNGVADVSVADAQPVVNLLVHAKTVAIPDRRDPVQVAAPPAAPRAVAAPAAASLRRPAAPAVPSVPPASPSSIIGIIQAAAARWGVSGSWMVSIARCESGLRTTAVNPGGPYIGLFQFLTSTFRGNGGTNIYSAADQANIAAKMLAHGQAHQWSCA